MTQQQGAPYDVGQIALGVFVGLTIGTQLGFNGGTQVMSSFFVAPIVLIPFPFVAAFALWYSWRRQRSLALAFVIALATAGGQYSGANWWWNHAPKHSLVGPGLLTVVTFIFACTVSPFSVVAVATLCRFVRRFASVSDVPTGSGPTIR
jgi:hypothetical protein